MGMISSTHIVMTIEVTVRRTGDCEFLTHFRLAKFGTDEAKAFARSDAVTIDVRTSSGSVSPVVRTFIAMRGRIGTGH